MKKHQINSKKKKKKTNKINLTYFVFLNIKNVKEECYNMDEQYHTNSKKTPNQTQDIGSEISQKPKDR